MASKKEDLKTIKEIVNSTNNVEGYESSSLSNKQIGSIYMYNKRIESKPGASMIEVSMMIKGVTDKISTRNGKTPVAAHKVLISLKVDSEEVTATELVNRIRIENPIYKDEEKYPFIDMVDIIQSESKSDKLLQGKTILPTNRKTYAIIKNKISPDTYMKVWCSCSSYYWVFQWYNVDNNIDIFGRRPEKYTYSYSSKVKDARGKSMAGKPAGSVPPVRNPGRHYGICKHLMLLLGMLMDEEVIENTNSGGDSPGSVYSLNISRFKTVEHLSYNQYQELTKKYKLDQNKKIRQRRAMVYGPKNHKPNFAQKNAGIAHKKFDWRKGR